MIFRLINWATSNYGLSVLGIAFPFAGLAFQTFGYPFELSYEMWLIITAVYYCCLLLAITDHYRDLIRALALTFPSAIVVLAVLPVFVPTLLDWPVLLGGIAFAGFLEAVTLKPERM